MALVGIVVVSHSRPLAEAAVEFATEMVHGESPRIRIAAGTPDGGFGTDALAVSEAIAAAEAGAGVVVCADIGSAVMSAEMSLEFLDPDDADSVRIVPAPFVEGLVAAVVQAATGATLDEVAAEASRALQPKQDALLTELNSTAGGRTPGGLHAELCLPNPAGMHARPAARIVAEVAKFDASVRVAGPTGHFVNASSPIALASVRAAHGERVQIEASGPQADAALDALVALIEDGFGELTDDSHQPSGRPSRRTGRPLGVSPGRVVGPAYILVPPMTAPPSVVPLPPSDLPQESHLLRNTIVAVARDYERRAAKATNREVASILQATAVLARDEMLVETSIQLMTESGIAASTAFWEAANQAAEFLAAAGGRIAERSTDIIDIRNRVVSQLLGLPMPGLPDPGLPYILLAEDLAPSDAASLSAGQCLAIVTRDGGLTSHTSILARSMGIPAVVGFRDIPSIPAGAVLLVDGSTGEVVVGPTAEQLASARTTAMPLVPLQHPGELADGTSVPLLANVGSVEGAVSAADTGAQGVGLLRTEMCFLNRTEEPGIPEQTAVYSAVLERFKDLPVVIRTLDAGSDKPMPFLTMPPEDNPALGVRGYRTAQIRPEVLARQLEAIYIATSTTTARPSVMAPMISTQQEAAAFTEQARRAGIERVGVMIETPAAALAAPELLQVVDFVSVGTNDLSQYTMAADRLSTELSGLLDPWHPSLLRLLRIVGEAGRAAGKPVGICGEAASVPELAPVLVGLGATSLSMSARSLHSVGEALRAVTLEDCRRAATAACGSASPGAAREAVAAALQ